MQSLNKKIKFFESQCTAFKIGAFPFQFYFLASFSFLPNILLYNYISAAPDLLRVKETVCWWMSMTFDFFIKMSYLFLAVVVAQLVEWSLPIPKVHSSNPVIGKIYIEQLFTINCIKKTKINKKRPGMAHLKNRLDSNTLGLEAIGFQILNKKKLYFLLV